MTTASFARIAAAAIRAGFVLLMLAASNSQAVEPKKILMVPSFGHSTSPYDLVSSAFRKGILDAWPGQAAFYDFALEAGRPVDNNESAIIEVIRNRFDGTKLDLVVAIGPTAALFYGKHREALFPSVPLL